MKLREAIKRAQVTEGSVVDLINGMLWGLQFVTVLSLGGGG